ncbi:hypothetical protein [Lactococcus kimchii]|uniref:hypothetical protein n=1 Tax=Lactococcus sp. S-13 TaxID=2507158 RepID=UPI001CC1C3DC|nr:hypothetical protein [Lactococcus sp. S-13]
MSFLLLILSKNVKADNQIDSQNTSAQSFITVTAPTNNIWTVNAPSLDFGSQTAAASLLSFNINASGPIYITNLSGTSTSFSLQQSVSEFTLTSGSQILPVTAFYLTVANSSDGKLVGSSAVNIFKQNGEVIRSGTSANGRMTSGAVNAQIRVDGASKVILTGSYKATISSTLISGP